VTTLPGVRARRRGQAGRGAGCGSGRDGGAGGVADRPAALRVNVLLPDGYDGKRHFPVLYLLHGHGDAYDYWVNPQKGDLLDIVKGSPASS
jgi:hypothetical protein